MKKRWTEGKIHVTKIIIIIIIKTVISSGREKEIIVTRESKGKTQRNH